MTTPTPLDTEQVISLYRIADWWEPEDDEREALVARIIAGSHCFCVALEDDAIVGMGRAISDGVSDAYIQDVTVLPRLRGQGIGTKLVELIIARLRQDGMRWIGLIAGGHSHPFYDKLGFMEMPYSMPMILKDDVKP